MSKFHVGTVDESKFAVPANYAAHSEGYRRLALIDDAVSAAAVHMGAGLVEIAPGGHHMPVIHAFEKGFYILSGEVILNFHGRAHRLSAGHYGVVSKAVQYTLFNPGDEAARTCALDGVTRPHTTVGELLCQVLGDRQRVPDPQVSVVEDRHPTGGRGFELGLSRARLVEPDRRGFEGDVEGAGAEPGAQGPG